VGHYGILAPEGRLQSWTFIHFIFIARQIERACQGGCTGGGQILLETLEREFFVFFMENVPKVPLRNPYLSNTSLGNVLTNWAFPTSERSINLRLAKASRFDYPCGWEWLGPGGSPGLQNLWRVALRAAVGSTPIHSRLLYKKDPKVLEVNI
jgi:hypothetical protein